MIEKIGEADIELIIKELLTFDNWQEERSLQGHSRDVNEDGNVIITDLKYPEHEYTRSIFKHLLPYTYLILNEFQMYRSRIMSLQERTCHSWHYDHAHRVHIPLITNEKCFLAIDDKIYHLPADGSIYIANTTLYHTAFNGTRDGEFTRTHIVGNVSYSL